MRHFFSANHLKGGRAHSGMRVLASRGSLVLPFTSSKEGKYTVKVKATASLGGNELARMTVTIDGNQIADFLIDAEYPNKKEYAFEFWTKSNFNNQITLTFPNDFWDPKNKDPKRRDRNLWVESVEVFSPNGVSENVKITRSHLIGKWKTEEIDDKVAIESLRKWLPRIYRFLVQSEFFRHTSFYVKMKDNGLTAIESLKQTFKAALVSPNFIFREENMLKENTTTEPEVT